MISQFPVAVEYSDTPDEATRFTCPECSRDDRTARVASVVRQQSGLIFPPSGSQQPQAYVSGLASVLSLPEPPRARTPAQVLVSILAAWLIGTLLLIPFVVLQQQNLVDLPQAPLEAGILATLFWFGLIMPAALVIMAMVSYDRSRRELPVWQALSAGWHQLYYCSRDDVVFLPGWHEAVLPEDMQDFLRRRLLAEPPVKQRQAHKRNGASV